MSCNVHVKGIGYHRAIFLELIEEFKHFPWNHSNASRMPSKCLEMAQMTPDGLSTLKIDLTGLLCTLKDENECNESLSENWKSCSSSVSPPCGGAKFVFVLRVSDSRYCGGLNWIGGGIISWHITKSKSSSEKKLSGFPKVFKGGYHIRLYHLVIETH